VTFTTIFKAEGGVRGGVSGSVLSKRLFRDALAPAQAIG